MVMSQVVTLKEGGSCYGGGQLMEGQWSCYREGHFNEGRMVMLQKWSL